MKKSLMMLAVVGSAAICATNTMVIHTKSGNTTIEVSVIDSITFKENSDPDHGITKQMISIFNGYGKGSAALDAVKGIGIKAGNLNSQTGELIYSSADSARVDFKTVNSVGRATNLVPELVSLNGTKYVAIDSSDFTRATASIKTFNSKLHQMADQATSTKLNYSASTPFFVAKLGAGRGYCLAKITAFNPNDSESSSTNTGRVDIEYYYISKSVADTSDK